MRIYIYINDNILQKKIFLLQFLKKILCLNSSRTIQFKLSFTKML